MSNLDFTNDWWKCMIDRCIRRAMNTWEKIKNKGDRMSLEDFILDRHDNWTMGAGHMVRGRCYRRWLRRLHP